MMAFLEPLTSDREIPIVPMCHFGKNHCYWLGIECGAR